MPTEPRSNRHSSVTRTAFLVALFAISAAFPPVTRPADRDRDAHAPARPSVVPAPPSSRIVDADEQDETDVEPDVDFDHRREAEFFRHIAGGDLDVERMRLMWAEARAVPSESPLKTQAVNTWQLAGPVFSTNVGGGFMTGRVRDIDPVNIRALAASGGLWRFDLFGGIPMSDPVPASWFGSFATRPTNSATILLGTGEFNIGSGTGLYKTTDGGATWTSKPMNPTPSSFSRVRWSPDGASAYASGTSGLFRSSDAGETWTRTLTSSVSDFSITVGAPALIWATMSGGVWRSTDAGVTWGMLTGGGVPNGIGGIGTVSAVSITGGSTTVYVAFDTRIWRSTNAGTSWTEVTPGFIIGNSGYGPVISACPADPTVVLYGDVPYCRSTDSGASWSKLASSHLHADYHMFAWDTDGQGVWAANDGGWSHSTDRGVTWSSSSNAMPVSQFYTIDCEKTELGYMLGGTQDNNVLYTPSPTLNWVDPAVGSTEGDAFGVTVDLYNPMQMWAISGLSGPPLPFPRKRTTDGGTTWTTVDNGIDPSNASGSIRTDNAFPVRLVTSTDTFVYESFDGGDTWAKSNPTAFPAAITSLTSSTRVAPNSVLYATVGGSAPGQRLFVRDGGTWVERSSGLPIGSIVKVVPHPWAGSASEAWAIMSGFATQKLFHTTDRGVSWSDVTGDFPASIPISDLVPNPRAPGELYVGSFIGCFRSRDGGVHWERWNNGMPQGAMVSAMTYIDLTSTTGQFFVVAATYGRSVWKRDVSGDDAYPALEVSAPFVQEGDTGQNTAWFRVHLPAPQITTVTASYSTADGTATLADNDYVASSGTIAIPPGQTDQWVGIPVNGDVQIEADEAFKLVLSNPLRALVGNPGVGTIQDDDAHGLVCGGLPGTDGTVNAIAVDGGTVYIGGSFNRVGPSSGNAASLDVTTGLPISLPKVDGSVNALAADGAGGWYLGGSFHHVAGAPRTGLAHLLADGTLAPWNPCADEIVFGLAVSHDTVYVGGRFTTISGVPMPYLAALSGSTGLPILALPVPNDQVLGIALNGPRLYVAGSFTTIGGSSRNYLASLDRVTGAVGTWNPNPNAAASALLLNGGSLYVGGNFSSIGGLPRSYIAAIDPVSGAAQPWNPVSDSYVFTIAADAGAIYAGGVFDNIGGRTMTGLAALDRVTGLATPWTPNVDGSVNALVVSGGTLYVGGAFSTAGGQPRNGLAALSTSSGAATAWNPNPSGSVAVLGVNGNTVFAGGYITGFVSQPRSSLAAFDANTGQLLPWDPRANSTVFALVASGGIVYAGGQFDSIGTQARSRLAAIDGVTGVPTSWDPSANGTVRTLLLSGARIYAGGSFTTMGGVTRNRGAAISTSTAVPPTSWNPNATSTINALATDGTFIYAGGAFTSIGGSAHLGLAQLNTTSGGSNPTWNPNTNGTVTMLVNIGSGLYVGGSFTQIAGLSRPRLAAIDLSTAAVLSWAPAPNNTVNALAVWGTQVYVGGAFTAIGGQWRNHLALLRPSTNQVSDWAPEPDGNVNAIALNGIIAYVGGAFTTLGGLPQAHVGCLIPSGYVDAPAATAGTPLAVRLSPNPAAGRVRIEYTLPVAARVSIAVYDVQGRRVGSALDALQEAGVHATTWERSLARTSPGIYFVRFAAGKQSVVRRLVLL